MGGQVPAADRDPRAAGTPRAAPSGGSAVTRAGTIEAVTSEVPLRHITAQELLRYRHEPYRQELIDGTLHEMEPTGAEHGLVEGRIFALLARHVEAARLGTAFVGEVGFQIASDPDTVRAPDVAFVMRERVAETGIPRGFWPGPPDLAVEVVSPGDTHSEVQGKALQWLGAGARAVVAVDPQRRTATVYRASDDVRILTAEDTLDLGDVVPGWSPCVGAFFA